MCELRSVILFPFWDLSPDIEITSLPFFDFIVLCLNLITNGMSIKPSSNSRKFLLKTEFLYDSGILAPNILKSTWFFVFLACIPNEGSKDKLEANLYKLYI